MEGNQRQRTSVNNAKKGKKTREKLLRVHSFDIHPSNNKANLCNLNWSSQPKMLHRNDASYSTFPYHVGYPIEAFSPLAVYPPFYSSEMPSNVYSPIPPVRKNRKSYGKGATHGAQVGMREQEYTSLPPVNCEGFSENSSDSESNSKRHFSDPGLGPASSVDSEEGDESLANPMYLNLMEEIRDLKENRLKMECEMTALRDQFLELKNKTCTHCVAFEYQPGTFTDAIGELRKAAQLTENSIKAKLDSYMEIASAQMKEMIESSSAKLATLESRLEQLEGVQDSKPTNMLGQGIIPPPVEKLIETSVPDAFRMLHTLEQQKRQLEENLKEALAGRSEAEANTQKLERLVAILRTKINGLSTDSSLDDGCAAANCNPLVGKDSLGKAHSKVSAEQNIPLDNKDISSPESTNLKSTCNSNMKVKTSLHSTTNPPISVKPNLSHLPKPVLPHASVHKPSNGNAHEHLGQEPFSKSNPLATKFAVGKAVTTGKKTVDGSDSYVFDQISAGPHMPTSFTISGPITDL